MMAFSEREQQHPIAAPEIAVDNLDSEDGSQSRKSFDAESQMYRYSGAYSNNNERMDEM